MLSVTVGFFIISHVKVRPIQSPKNTTLYYYSRDLEKNNMLISITYNKHQGELLIYQKLLAFVTSTVVRSSPVPFWTDAGVSIDGIDALTAILTLILFTVVIIQLTVLAYVAWNALTPKMNTHTQKCLLLLDSQGYSCSLWLPVIRFGLIACGRFP